MGSRSALLDAVFLSHDGMARVSLLDSAANELFGLPVGDGDGGVVGLEIRAQASLEVAQSESSRQVGGLVGEVEVVAQ